MKTGTKNNRVRTPQVFRRVAVTALAAALLAGAVAPGVDPADSTAAPKAAAGQHRTAHVDTGHFAARRAGL